MRKVGEVNTMMVPVTDGFEKVSRDLERGGRWIHGPTWTTACLRCRSKAGTPEFREWPCPPIRPLLRALRFRGLADWRAFAAAEDAVAWMHPACRANGANGCAVLTPSPERGRRRRWRPLSPAVKRIRRPAATGRWSGILGAEQAILLLEEAEFVAVRTNRNQLKIRREEQAALSGKAVGIVGLSVGRSMALALAMERIVGTLHIADADTIELSNLNRMSCSVFELGTEKWCSTARAIAEIDPYLEVVVWPKGLPCGGHGGFHGRHWTSSWTPVMGPLPRPSFAWARGTADSH